MAFLSDRLITFDEKNITQNMKAFSKTVSK